MFQAAKTPFMPQKQKESAEGILCSSWNCYMSENRLGSPDLTKEETM